MTLIEPVPRFHSLRVGDVRRETPDTVSIAFDVPGELGEAYRFEPGQHLTIRVRDDAGRELRRSYSICSGVDDGELRVAVKRLPGGVFGTYASETLRVGDVLEVMTPAGRFTTAVSAARARNYLGVAVGSGITPIMSLLRSILSREPGSRFTLVYGNRTTASIIFREALEDLKNLHASRFHLVHVLTADERAAPLLNGRITPDKLRALSTTLIDVESCDDVFLCGPPPMADAARSTLLELGVDPRRVHVELFGTGAVTTAPPRREPTARRRHVTYVINGVKHDVDCHPDDTLLEAGQRHGLELPFACKGGVCATCRARLVEGEVEMSVNHALEEWETTQGFVLTCQSHPTTDRVVVDYDAR